MQKKFFFLNKKSNKIFSFMNMIEQQLNGIETWEVLSSFGGVINTCEGRWGWGRTIFRYSIKSIDVHRELLPWNLNIHKVRREARKKIIPRSPIIGPKGFSQGWVEARRHFHLGDVKYKHFLTHRERGKKLRNYIRLNIDAVQTRVCWDFSEVFKTV